MNSLLMLMGQSPAIPKYQLYTWGDNYYGQGGTGDNARRNVPTKIGNLSWRRIAAGLHHSLGITEDGRLHSCGNNKFGELGLGDKNRRNVFTQVSTDADWKEIAGGEGFSLALKRDGTLWACGWNRNGRLGMPGGDQNVFTQIGTGTDWRFITAGEAHAFAIKRDRSLYGWGSNGDGRLGIGGGGAKNVPTQVGTDADWLRVSAGKFHTIGIRNTPVVGSGGYIDALSVWGGNGFGQLGTGGTSSENSPKIITARPSDAFNRISAGETYSLAVGGRELWVAGNNTEGMLGLGDTTRRPHLTRFGYHFESVSAGTHHSLSVGGGYYLNACGGNNESELGTGDNNRRTRWTTINDTLRWYAVSAGNHHSMALSKNF